MGVVAKIECGRVTTVCWSPFLLKLCPPTLQVEARRMLEEKGTVMAALQKSQDRSEVNYALAGKLADAIGASHGVQPAG